CTTISLSCRGGCVSRKSAAGDTPAATELDPFRHLLRERALRAIGIILHAKVFVDLEQPLLVRDGFQEFFPAQIISAKPRRRGFESPIRQLCRQLCVFCPERRVRLS